MRAALTFVLLLGCAAEPAPEPPSEEPPTEAPDEPSWCDNQGWTERPFVTEAAFGFQRRDVADDFAVETTAGPWVFSEEFTGCETYLFIPEAFRVSPLDSTPLIHKVPDLAQLLDDSPPNVHYFFATQTGDEAAMQAFADAMDVRLDSALMELGEAWEPWWRERVHVLTEPIGGRTDWVGQAFGSGAPGFGVDRFQRIRHIGQLADVLRPNNDLAQAGYWSWEANVAYVAHEARYYNYRSDLQDRLDAVDWDEHYLFYDEGIWQTGRSTATVELPDAATMAGYDTLWVDLSHLCDPSLQEFGNCDAWDANNQLHLCDPDEPAVCDDLVARWITTYHREGRWLVDASEALPRLKEGGTQRFRYGGARGGHYITARLLFANTGKGAVPFAMEPLWEGGGWGETYNDDHGPMEITVPADATAVHLSVTVTGHGMSDPHNCAEFCDHQHRFTVGGDTFVAEHPEMGDRLGCRNQIENGTVPNQHGTWWFERSSWCPGKQVDPWIFDLTDSVTPGETATLEYSTNWSEPAYGGNINLQTWVTYWR